MLSKKLKITVTSETKNLLQKEAARRGVSLSEVVRSIFNEQFNEPEAGGPGTNGEKGADNDCA